MTYAWFISACYHPPPPGKPPGQVQPFGPGGGELFQAVFNNPLRKRIWEVTFTFHSIDTLPPRLNLKSLSVAVNAVCKLFQAVFNNPHRKRIWEVTFTFHGVDTLPPRLNLVHFCLLPSPPPPGKPPGQVQPFGPGGGELFQAILSRG